MIKFSVKELHYSTSSFACRKVILQRNTEPYKYANEQNGLLMENRSYASRTTQDIVINQMSNLALLMERRSCTSRTIHDIVINQKSNLALLMEKSCVKRSV